MPGLTYSASGPGLDREVPNALSALLLAQRAAERAPDESTFYVRGRAQQVIWRVTRTRGVVYTEPNGGVQR